jgi:D-inositol-3-phosphate glycosyltransferase
MNLIKAAIIEPVGGHGGMDYYDFGLCGGLAAAGLDIVIHTCDETNIPSNVRFTVKHTYVGIYGGSAAWLRGLRFVFGSFKALGSALLERRKFVHLHFFHVGGLALMNVLLSKLMKRVIIITAHDVESFVSTLEVPLMSRLAYRLADHVIAHNRISRVELQARLHVPENKIAVIPHGNYLHALRPMPSVDVARKKLGIPCNAKVLLFFGQIKEVKGLDVLLNAMPVVLQHYPDAVLLIAGRPWKTDFSGYQNKIDGLGIQSSCFAHIRFIPDEEVPLYYGAAELVVLPYRRIYQSGVLLMAMSYGKAVLVSDIPGMLEVVRDQESGFVFRSGDADDLVRKICTLFGNPAIVESVASSGQKLMKEKYDWADIGQQTKELYASLVN